MVVADFSLRQKERGMNSAKTVVGKVVADFSLRQKQRGLNFAKMVEDVVVADFSLRQKERELKFAKTDGKYGSSRLQFVSTSKESI